MNRLEAFAEAYAKVGAGNRRSLEKLRELLLALRARGVEAILLKGADLATRGGAPLGLRAIGDIDLLARPEDLPRLDAAARALGLRPKIDGNAAYIDAEGSFIVDVMTEVWYLEDCRGLWARSRVGEALGTSARALAPADALLFSCAWVCLHRAWLSDAFAEDVARLAADSSLDWPSFVARAREAGLAVPVFFALRWAAAKRRVPGVDAALHALAPQTLRERAELRLLARLVTERRLLGLSHALVLATRPRGRRLAALRRSLFPEAEFMAYRYGPQAGLGTRLARPLYLAARAAGLAGKIVRRLALSS